MEKATGAERPRRVIRMLAPTLAVPPFGGRVPTGAGPQLAGASPQHRRRVALDRLAMDPDRPIEPIYREGPPAPASRRPSDVHGVLVGLGVLVLLIAFVLVAATVVIWWWRTVIG